MMLLFAALPLVAASGRDASSPCLAPESGQQQAAGVSLLQLGSRADARARAAEAALAERVAATLGEKGLADSFAETLADSLVDSVADRLMESLAAGGEVQETASAAERRGGKDAGKAHGGALMKAGLADSFVDRLVDGVAKSVALKAERAALDDAPDPQQPPGKAGGGLADGIVDQLLDGFAEKMQHAGVPSQLPEPHSPRAPRPAGQRGGTARGARRVRGKKARMEAPGVKQLATDARRLRAKGKKLGGAGPAKPRAAARKPH